MAKTIRKLLFTAVLGICLGAALLVAAGYWLLHALPDVSKLKGRYPAVEYKGKDQIATVRLVKSRPVSWVSLKQISPYAVGAFIVSEDWSFYSHPGVDVPEIQKMLHEAWEDPERLRGASTITQQVVKNIFLTPEKSLLRKLREIMLALRLERHFSKNQILEMYFNIVELGPGIYGIRQASLAYFDKPPSAVTPKEAAFLAMLLPNPKRYSQSFRQHALTPYAHATIDHILEKMRQGGYLSDEEFAACRKQPLSFEHGESPGPVETPRNSDAEHLSI